MPLTIKLFVALFLAVITSPSLAQQPGITDRDKAMDAYISCLRAMAARYDDRTSSADVIGRAIAPMCRKERLAAEAFAGPFRSKRAQRILKLLEPES